MSSIDPKARSVRASGDVERAEGVSLAALLLCSLLLFGAWPQSPASNSVPCANPIEARAEGGWTVEVVCADAAIGHPAVRGPARLLFGRGLDLNRADADALQVLPGIGPSRASAILESRKIEPFAEVADLQRVHGIGPKTIAGLEGWVVVEEAL
jgi:predicted flap endonuclease-1-like 5' DNA nuclease